MEKDVMKTAIAVYRPLCYIKRKNGDYLFSDLANMDRIKRDANDTKINILDIDGVGVQRFDIEEIAEYNPEGSDIKIFIATRTSEERRVLARRSQIKYQRVGREIETVEEALNFLAKWRA